MYYLTCDMLYNFFFFSWLLTIFWITIYILIAGYMLFFKYFLGEIDTQIFVLVLQNSASMSGLK